MKTFEVFLDAFIFYCTTNTNQYSPADTIDFFRYGGFDKQYYPKEHIRWSLDYNSDGLHIWCNLNAARRRLKEFFVN